MNLDYIRRRFEEPGAAFRTIPFWAWNDELSPEELTRQIHDMREHGVGGVVIHAREGLEAEYMGEKWMQCVRHSVQEARKAGMTVWLYDEDRWPSGYGGGKVAALGDEYRPRCLRMYECKESRQPVPGDVVAVFQAQLQGDTLTGYQRVESTEALPQRSDGAGLVFSCAVDRGVYPRFNGSADIDRLNPKAVKAFLDLIYEPYKAAVGEEFGQTIQAAFTDEPSVKSYRAEGAASAIAWTQGFAAFFRTKRGYDILDHLPALFFATEESARAKHDYYLTIAQLFASSYTKQLANWCERNGLAFTGHYQEWIDDLYDQIEAVGAVMPLYVHHQIPCIDMHGVCTGESVTVRQCTSVAHQFGRKWAAVEVSTSAGWDLTFDDQKWVGDWLCAQGINVRVPHLSWYSLRGCRKRDWPASFNYHANWWKYIKVVEDYFARLGSVLSEGRPIREVLLLHPMTSAWLLYDREAREPVRRFSWEFRSIADSLMAAHYDFDLGDELILEEHGRVVSDSLRVKEAKYRLVVIPPVLTLRGSTVRLLMDFLKAGGKVIAIGDPPELTDGSPSNEAQQVFHHKNCLRIENRDHLIVVLERSLRRRVSIRRPAAEAAMSGSMPPRSAGGEASDFFYMERQLDDGNRVCFIFNSDRDKGCDVVIDLGGRGVVQQWDAMTGEVAGIGVSPFTSHFGPGGSKLFVVRNDGEPGSVSSGEEILEDQPPPDCVGVAQYGWSAGPYPVAYIGPVTTFHRTEPNILTLDTCCYRIANEPWSETLPVWRAQLELRDRLGMRPIHQNDCDVQRYLWCKQPHPRDGTPVEFRFTFTVRDVPSQPLYLLIEGVPWFTFTLNGEPLSGEPCGWYLDRSLHKVLLPAPRDGENELVCRCEYRNSYEVEDCFLLGDFAVEAVSRVLVQEPEVLRFGDWTLQGYPHYAGSIIYEDAFTVAAGNNSAYYLQLGDNSAVNVTIWVNGNIAGHIPWRSRRVINITDHLEPGENRIGIEVMSGPRNMLGPLHNKAGPLPHTHHGLFRTTEEEYTDGYMLRPWGLFGQVRIYRGDGV